jgi:hypothetical protein
MATNIVEAQEAVNGAAGGVDLQGMFSSTPAVDPNFRTTGLSGICVLKMLRKDAWKWEENEEHLRTNSRPR